MNPKIPSKVRNGKTRFGFTLGELIVVITILAILATIGFLALSGYTQDARNSVIASNTRSVYVAIASESALTGNSPRFYVVHDPAVALSGAVTIVTASGPQALVWGDWNVSWTNYSAWLPDFAKLRLNPEKFRLSSSSIFPIQEVFAESFSGILVGAADVTDSSGSSGSSPRPVSYVQVAGVSPSDGTAVVVGNYSATEGSTAGLIDSDSDKSSTGAIVDGSSPSSTSSQTTSLPTPVSLSSGGYSSCVAMSDGTVKCWWWNANTQLGDGSAIDRPTPVAVPGISNAVEVSMGSAHACARLSTWTVKCWWMGANGRLWNNSLNNSLTPVDVLDTTLSVLTGAVSIKSWIFGTCALTSAGSLKCWGQNDYGMSRANWTTWGDQKTAITIPWLTGTITSFSIGNNFGCVSFSDGTGKCWGNNNGGQLGDGTTTTRYSPVASLTTNIAEYFPSFAGDNTACARLTNGTVKCWGPWYAGQMWNGTTAPTNTWSNAPVSGISTATKAFGGGGTYYVTLSDGSMSAWGMNSSTFSYLWPGNANTPVSSPVTVSPSEGILEISRWAEFTCARFATSVKCWWRNDMGRLWDGTTVSKASEWVDVLLN